MEALRTRSANLELVRARRVVVVAALMAGEGCGVLPIAACGEVEDEVEEEVRLGLDAKKL
jgi:hypothetical protein